MSLAMEVGPSSVLFSSPFASGAVNDPLLNPEASAGSRSRAGPARTAKREQDPLLTAYSKVGRRRSTLGALSNASNEDMDSRRGSIGSALSQLDLISALQQPPTTLHADRRGRLDILGALKVAPEDVLESQKFNSRRLSAISTASNVSGPSVDMLQALRAGPALARRPVTPAVPLTPVDTWPRETPRSSISSQSGAPSSYAHTTAPLLGDRDRDRISRRSRESLFSMSSLLSVPRNEAQNEASATAFADLRRRVTASRSLVALQLVEELAAAAAEHACAPTSSTARELDQVAQEVADSHGVGQAMTAALARGGYPPLALSTPSDAARLWRDLKGIPLEPDADLQVDGAPSQDSQSGRSEELLDEGRRRWTAWLRGEEA